MEGIRARAKKLVEKKNITLYILVKQTTKTNAKERTTGENNCKRFYQISGKAK